MWWLQCNAEQELVPAPPKKSPLARKKRTCQRKSAPFACISNLLFKLFCLRGISTPRQHHDVAGTLILYVQGSRLHHHRIWTLPNEANSIDLQTRPLKSLNHIEPIEPLMGRNKRIQKGAHIIWSWPRTLGPPWFQLGAVNTQRKTPSRSPAADLERKELDIKQSRNGFASGLPCQPLVQISLKILHHTSYVACNQDLQTTRKAMARRMEKGSLVSVQIGTNQQLHWHL